MPLVISQLRRPICAAAAREKLYSLAEFPCFVQSPVGTPAAVAKVAKKKAPNKSPALRLPELGEYLASKIPRQSRLHRPSRARACPRGIHVHAAAARARSDRTQLSLGLPIAGVGLRQLEVLHELLEARLVLEEAPARELQGRLETIRAAQHRLLARPVLLEVPVARHVDDARVQLHLAALCTIPWRISNQ